MPDPSRAESIANRARALDRTSRDKYLDSACGSDAALRNKVEAMLREGSAHTSDSKETLLPPVHDVGMPRLDAGPAHEAPGSMIGPYKLLQQLGEGGFGTVFMAEQETPVARRVALKIIKLGMDTKQVVARFEQERQALAMMDHPNIAKVFDAGATTTGRPYFVMELCKGEPITDYCNKASLSIADRLALFVQVCQAVQHAHLKGLIHRDIKPSNVLVSDQDGKPSAKVIDFGIAKATAHKLTEKTLFTEQAQMIGTPEYMSPEQAEGSLDIDTRTDIYALGVLLYELLTGMTPFDAKRLRSVAYAEIQRIIREVEPPHPSTRLSDVGRESGVVSRESSDQKPATPDPRLTLETLAKSRSIDPQRLVKMLRGELDWIVMKALEKDRRRRYETATGLGLDIQRYLAGEAVEAAPPSKAYRLKKFIVRNKGPVVATSLVALALVGGLIGTSYGLRQAVVAREAESTARKNAETQRTIAEAQRDKAEHIAAFMSETLSGVGPSVALGRDVKMLKEMMDGAAARIDKGELKKVPDAESALRNTIGRVYMDIAQYPEATKMLEPAVTESRALHSGDDPATASAIYAFGVLRHKQGDLQGAEPLLREALAMRERLFPGDNDGVASVQNDLAVLLEDSGHNADAEKNYRAALDMRQRLFPGDHRDVAVSLNSLARVLKVSGNPVEAERLLRESLEMQKRLFKGDHPDLAVDLANLALVLQDRGDLAGAEPLYRESIAMMQRLFAGDNPLLASTMRNLARTLQNRGDMNGAEPLYRDAIAMNRRLLPGDSLSAAADYQNLGMFLQARGNLADAEPAFRASLEMNRRLIKVDHPNIAAVMNNLAFILLARGDAAGAEPLAREAVAMGERLNGKDDFITANSRLKLGRALLGMKRFADAETELIETERVMATAKNVPPARRAQAVEALVELYKSWDAAEPGTGRDAKVSEWSKKLAALRPATTKPATSNPSVNR